MSNKRVFTGFIILLSGLVIVLGLKNSAIGRAGQIRSAQASTAKEAPIPVMPAPLIATKSANAEASSVSLPVFNAAALKNAQLQTDLSWAFGGKSQRGWQLYVGLISSLIGTHDESSTSRFAEALARWQKEQGIEPLGMLNETTWFEMISTWQSQRIKDRGYPSPDQLVTAPTADFYDPSRPDELRRVEREAYAAYKRMIAAAAADSSLGLKVTPDGQLATSETYLKIISAHRSREYQANLRKQSPNSGRAGLAVNSPHFTGRALDIYVGGEPVSTKDDNRAIQVRTPVYRWLVKNAAKFGFQPYFYEPWHWEYVGIK